jgi:ketosteroid isomerase-like protein
MTPEERADATRECERLVYRYASLIDFGEAEKVAELFAPDGVWESPQGRLEGNSAIRDQFRRRQDSQRRSRHVCTNVVIDVVDDHTATGLTYFTLYRHDGGEDGPAPLDGPAMVGEYRDRFVRTEDGWRFLRREAAVAFLREGVR